MRGFLTVTPRDLEWFSATDAEDFFRELLWAEASRIGIGKQLIDAPTKINVADGGIDAEVVGADVSSGQGIIRQGSTRYQIKSGNFNISQDYYIDDILFTSARTQPRTLKPRIQACFENGDALVVVLFGWDNPTSDDIRPADKIKTRLVKEYPQYQNAHIEVWAQHKIIGFLKPFPSLALKAKRWDAEAKFQTHGSWSRDGEMTREFAPGEPQLTQIAAIREGLRAEAPTHLAITGAPGIGKTRLVLEATRTDDLQPLVTYFNNPEDLMRSQLFYQLLREDNVYAPILIVDECGYEEQRKLWDKLQYREPRIKLVTITKEREIPDGLSIVEVAELEEEHLSRILSVQYQIPADYAVQWARLCEGYPRMAHLIGEGLQRSDQSVWKSASLKGAVNLIIAGRDPLDSAKFANKYVVLKWLALFKRLGIQSPYENEFSAIVSVLEEKRGLHEGEIREAVRELRDRKILQGNTTVYITPKIVHIRMWIDWWETYGDSSLLVTNLISSLPSTLLDYFFQMFEYADPVNTPAASNVVCEILGTNGVFQQESEFLQSETGARFFRYLATAEPEPALKLLMSTVGKWSKEKLLGFSTGRREVVHALESIARWKELFSDAARLLLSLGEAENEHWTNNASGVFTELFSFQVHPAVSRTEATPTERLQILQEALESNSIEQRQLALRACKQALQTYQGGMVINRPRVIGKEPEPWVPSTWGELWDAYRLVWEYLHQKLDDLGDNERVEATKILLESAPSIARIRSLREMVIDTLVELGKQGFVDKRLLLQAVVRTLRYSSDGLNDETRNSLEYLKEELTGKDFHSLLRHYMSLNLWEDVTDETGSRADHLEKKLQELASQAMENREQLVSELDWLVTGDAQHGYRFGVELASADPTASWLPIILTSQRQASSRSNASAYFLGGYMSVLAEDDLERWEEHLDRFANDPGLLQWVPELTVRSDSLTGRAGSRILKLLESGKLDFRELSWFRLGGIIQRLPPQTFQKWLEFLLDVNDPQAVYIALDLAVSYYVRDGQSREIPETLVFDLLTHPSLTVSLETKQHLASSEYEWTELARAYLDTHQHSALEMSKFVLSNLGIRGTVFESHHTRALFLLDEIAARYSKQIWLQITEHITPSTKPRNAFWITQWLRGEQDWGEKRAGALIYMPPEAVWEWIEEDVDTRAWYFASFVPPNFHHDAGICWTRELLVKYGDREDVRRNLVANFSTEGWTGEASHHYENKRQMLLELKETEENSKVLSWLDFYIDVLAKDIEQAKIREERGLW